MKYTLDLPEHIVAMLEIITRKPGLRPDCNIQSGPDFTCLKVTWNKEEKAKTKRTKRRKGELPHPSAPVRAPDVESQKTVTRKKKTPSRYRRDRERYRNWRARKSRGSSHQEVEMDTPVLPHPGETENPEGQNPATSKNLETRAAMTPPRSLITATEQGVRPPGARPLTSTSSISDTSDTDKQQQPIKRPRIKSPGVNARPEVQAQAAPPPSAAITEPPSPIKTIPTNTTHAAEHINTSDENSSHTTLPKTKTLQMKSHHHYYRCNDTTLRTFPWGNSETPMDYFIINAKLNLERKHYYAYVAPYHVYYFQGVRRPCNNKPLVNEPTFTRLQDYNATDTEVDVYTDAMTQIGKNE